MSLASKFPGGGRVGQTGGPSLAPTPTRSARSGGERDVNRTVAGPGRGDESSTRTISSHNDISRFTSGISSKHPYNERGGAFDTTKRQFQAPTSSRSSFSTPSGGTRSTQRGNARVSQQSPSEYDSPNRNNAMPRDAGSMRQPSGPNGGVRGMMNGLRRSSSRGRK